MKKGVSLLIVILAVSIMLVLISTASVIGSKSIISANYEEFNLVLQRVADEVNDYYIANKTLPIKNESINISTYGDLYEYINNTNDSKDNFYIVDMDKLNDETIEKGRGTTASRDIFIVAETSHNVYYVAGFTYNKVKYFGVN